MDGSDDRGHVAQPALLHDQATAGAQGVVGIAQGPLGVTQPMKHGIREDRAVFVGSERFLRVAVDDLQVARPGDFGQFRRRFEADDRGTRFCDPKRERAVSASQVYDPLA